MPDPPDPVAPTVFDYRIDAPGIFLEKRHYCGCALRSMAGILPVPGKPIPDDAFTRDHIVPRCQGGRGWVACCQLCNSIKAYDPHEVFITFMRFPEARKRKTRKTRYLAFRNEILKIGLTAFEEEMERVKVEDGA